MYIIYKHENRYTSLAVQEITCQLTHKPKIVKLIKTGTCNFMQSQKQYNFVA